MNLQKRQFASIYIDYQFGIALFIKEPINKKTLKLQCLGQAKNAEKPYVQGNFGLLNEVVNEVVNEVLNEVVNEVVNEVLNEVLNEVVNEVLNEVVNEVLNEVVKNHLGYI